MSRLSKEDLEQMSRDYFQSLDKEKLVEVAGNLHKLAVEQLEKLEQNSSNSSLPPSSDQFKKKEKSGLEPDTVGELLRGFAPQGIKVVKKENNSIEVRINRNIMTLHPQDMSQIPENTVQVARKSFPKGNIYMKMREEIGILYKDEDFVTLYSADCGQGGISAGQLALVTVMQFVEGLTDRQAADAVRGHIDWKYALSLELDDPGFDYSVLSEFRKRLIQAGREQELLNKKTK